MSLENTLNERSQGQCELCSSQNGLAPYLVPASSQDDADAHVLLCDKCLSEIEQPEDVNHWRCLNDSMWSQVPAVQVLAWRQLKRLSGEVWARDLLDMLYLDDATLKWAEAGISDDDNEPTLDSNGTALTEGDSVTLIKDLDVKGAGFTAKRGTLVKDIRLTNNPKHIEGKVNGVQIVLVAAFLKKA
ncbi:PhnA domain-containing protein [Gallaecimonas mangrovi]|uniref:PhnA domain-containing protein n=1 Tax=Gallaecimonas mangrovi TaxID=2291597 RepID=UPI000E1FE494|nr:alkylphosphonate utilization protein [Gallaecimonas mangrovi]